MKKLMMIICITLSVGITSYAQTYLRADDAIDALKNAQHQLRETTSFKADATKVSVHVNNGKSTPFKLNAAKQRALVGLLNTIPKKGNNLGTLQSILANNSITDLRLLDQDAQHLESYLLEIISKTE